MINQTKTYRPLYRRKRFYLLMIICVGLLKIYDFAEFRLDDGTLTASLGKNALSLTAQIGRYEVDGRKLRYVEIGRDTLPLIVFIHGAPASSAFWLSMLRDSNLLSRASLLAVDRPGYGFSGFGEAEISVRKQAAAIATLLREKRKLHSSIVLHGSSYGGTVAARLAMDFPDLVDGLLLQSASMEAGAEKTFWITHPTSHWLLSWLIPKTLAVANAEKLSHHQELLKMAPLWNQICASTIILHGTDDWLIYPSNAYFACERLESTSYLEMYMAAGRGHDLLWTERQELFNALEKLLALSLQ